MIINKDLLCEGYFADPKALEYEIDLKANLLEHHDYEAVSRQIFEVLNSWYGCDYEIFRVLRPNPFGDGKMYLDLYPSRFNLLYLSLKRNLEKKFKRKPLTTQAELRPNSPVANNEALGTARGK